MFIESLQSALTSDSGMVTILGTPTSRADSTNGVFPSQAIDGPTMPYLVCSQLSGAPSTGEMMTGSGPLTTERWRFSCCGTTYLKAKQFGKYARRFLLSLHGSQSGSVNIHSADCIMEADDSEPLGKGTMYLTHVDFEFVYFDSDVS
jgi:hypothetical protein